MLLVCEAQIGWAFTERLGRIVLSSERWRATVRDWSFFVVSVCVWWATIWKLAGSERGESVEPRGVEQWMPDGRLKNRAGDGSVDREKHLQA